MTRVLLAWGVVVLLGSLTGPSAAAATLGKELIVHEWGTFTSLQDESGKAVGGINADDEPVPGFVHRVGGRQIVDGRATRDPMSLRFSKSIPASHPDVTMRLETPVVYFHPVTGAGPTPVDVAVTFRGGWLTEFYPRATADVDGTPYDPEKKFKVGRITDSSRGGLSWPSLIIGTNGTGPQTDSRVWKAPRNVPAAAMVTVNGSGDRKSESERFLFYRGIGHVDSPLRVIREGERLRFETGGTVGGTAWLVDIRADGRSAFRAINLSAANATTPATFADADYGPHLDGLRPAMLQALVADGLYPDEAHAMLNTWEASYFKNAGTRVFFMVPRAWTDAVLPLSITTAAGTVPRERIVRTMVGRVELVTPAYRELLKVVANPPSKEAQVKAYKAIGRFRDALVIAEHARKPTASLAKLKEEQLIGQHDLSKTPGPDVLSGR